MPSLESFIRTVPNFPKPGIMFRDVTTLFKDPSALRQAAVELARPYREERISKVLGIESRGFVLGTALALELGAGFVPVRKAGKLPAPTIGEEYTLEYGTDRVEVHTDAIEPGERVLLHDDLLATGGTMAAAIRLTERLGAKVVGVCFLIELTFLHGRGKLRPYDPHSLIRYDAE
jgi:adenine phosphoribosyltransferase